MRYLLTALGSYGDVHPMVGLGAALRRRGHEVAIITNPHFQSVVESVGVEFLGIGTAEEYDELAHHSDLWDSLRGPLLVMRTTLVDLLPKLYALVDRQVVPGETVLVAHVLDIASRIHHDKRGTPLASVHFAPIMFRSLHQSPRMYNMLLASWVPRWFRRLQFWLADQMIDRLVAGEINALRARLELPPVRRILREWYFSPQLVLGLFPDWFAPPQPDWPPQTRLTGFPLWDESETISLAAEVEEFLAAGEPPLVFAPGSAMTAGEWFFQAAIEASQQLGRRAILLTKYPQQLPPALPKGVLHCEFVPFSRLLPRAAALVHHGGIGTCGQALAAGIPQLVMPMAYDQLDNATRLQRLGVAHILRPKRFTAENLTQALHWLLEQEEVHDQCRHWAGQFNTPAAMTTTCELLEQLVLCHSRILG